MICRDDLNHFIACYKPTINIIDTVNHKINVIDDSGVKKGILFCDSRNLLWPSSNSSLFNSTDLKLFKERTSANELWVVFIADRFIPGFIPDAKQFFHFIEENHVISYYNKIFFFNFFQSKISQFK